MSNGKTDTWYPMYPADYLKDTLDLTLEEDGFYTRALNQVYINKGRIPVEPERLQRLLRVQFNRCKWILGKYFYQAGDTYGNARADIEIAKANRNAEVARVNGMRGGRPRIKPDGIPNGLPMGNPAGYPTPNPEKSSSSSSSPSSPIGEDPPIVPQPKKAVRKKPNPKTLIAPEWQPAPETMAWCASKRLPEPDYQVPMFINHFQGKGEARADWDASFRNWMLSPYRKDRINGNHGKSESAAERNGRRFQEELGKIAAGIGSPGDHEVLPVLPQADA
jgi:uncharacterized protein YdaU (DUF1376 family)